MTLKKEYRSANGVGAGVFENISDNLGGWLSGAADLTDAIKGNQKGPSTVVYQDGDGKNMGLILGIGAAIVVVIIILVFAFKK